MIILLFIESFIKSISHQYFQNCTKDCLSCLFFLKLEVKKLTGKDGQNSEVILDYAVPPVVASSKLVKVKF